MIRGTCVIVVNGCTPYFVFLVSVINLWIAILENDYYLSLVPWDLVVSL
jgi:hypothetical protein